MARVIIDESSAEYKESSGFEVLPTGKYNAEVFSAKIREFGNNGVNAGRPYLSVQYRIIDGQHTNRRVFDNLPFFLRWNAKREGEKGFPTNLASFLVETGIGGYDDEDIEGFVEDIQHAKVGLVLGIETYNGEERNTVKRYVKVGDTSGGESSTSTAGGAVFIDD